MSSGPDQLTMAHKPSKAIESSNVGESGTICKALESAGTAVHERNKICGPIFVRQAAAAAAVLSSGSHISMVSARSPTQDQTGPGQYSRAEELLKVLISNWKIKMVRKATKERKEN